MRKSVAALSWTENPAIVSVVLSLVVLATRIPFATRFFFDWDSIQFALGLERFDLAHHQPHPPGYILYMGAARLFAFFTHDLNAGFVAVSIVASLGATLVVFALVQRLVRDRWSAALVACAFAFNPYVWFYGEVALNYIGDVFVSVAAAYLTLRILRERRPALLLALTALLALAGGFRQSSTLLFAPLWLLSLAALLRARKLNARILVTNVLLGLGLTALWLVPLVLLAGGIPAFRAALGTQAALSAGMTSVFFGAPWRITAEKAALIGKMLVAVVHVGLFVPPVVLVVRRGATLFRAEDRILAALAATWILPSLLVYIFLHMGGSGYLMTVAPALILAFLLPAARLAERPEGRVLGRTIIALVILLEAASFLFLNDPLFRRVPIMWEGTKSLERANHFVITFSRATLVQNDLELEQMLDKIRMHAPESTVVVTEIGRRFRPPGTETWVDNTRIYFRHMGYYLPEYEVVEIVGDTGAYYKTRQHAPAEKVFGTDIPISADTEQLVVVTEYVDRDAQRESGMREELLLPSRKYLFWIDLQGKESVRYAGYTFRKSSQ
mgnify:CR=1 FL=1